eukprot:6353925-Pyramimonas_sp.AAC.1
MAAQRLEQKGSRLVQHAGRPRGDAGVSFARQESGRLADKVGHGVRYGGRAAHGQDHLSLIHISEPTRPEPI